jgi:hypothetical protein
LPRQVALGQQQPVIASVLDQASARLHQPLLQAVIDSCVDHLQQCRCAASGSKSPVFEAA